MKKSRLLFSIVSLCFALAVLTFGVFAANQVNYTISGNISYVVTDCYVEVNTKAYTVNTRQYYADLHHIVDGDFSHLQSNGYVVLDDGSNTHLNMTYATATSTSYDSREANSYSNTTDFENLEFTTGNSAVYAYIFVINVHNLSDDVNVWAVVDNYTVPDNTIYTTNYSEQIIGTHTTDEPNNKNIVFAIALDDVTANIPQAHKSFSIALQIGAGDYEASDYIKTKLTISNGVASKKDTSISGVVVIPDNGVTELAASGFLGCTNVIDFYIPYSVETIGERVFSGCIGLKTLNLPFTGGDLPSKEDYDHISLYFENYNDEDDEYLPTGTYVYVSDVEKGYLPLSLKNISFVYGCTEIPSGSLYNEEYQSFIENVFIPNSVKVIHGSAFQCCYSLKSIYIPIGVEDIESCAFRGSNNLGNVYLPSTLMTIQMECFDDTLWLNNIQSTNGLKIATSYDDESVKFLMKANNDEISANISSNSIANVKIIAAYSFINCNNLRSINLPSGAMSICDSAFMNCTNLINITLSNSIKFIDTQSFNHCANLTSIDIPSTIEIIGSLALGSCYSLSQIIIRATTPPTLDISAFISINNFQIYVPSASVETYKAASGWSNYASRIQAIPA